MKILKCVINRESVTSFGIIAIVFGLLVPFAIGGISLNSSQPTINQSEELFEPGTPRGQYTTVDPINITESEDWANYAFITGTGTETDPYIIENVEIVGDDFMFENQSFESFGIYIYDIEASYVIRDCKISQFHMGIYCGTLGSLASHLITKNDIDHCGIGIYTFGDYCNITQNTVSECRALSKNRKWLGENSDPYNAMRYGGTGIYVFSLGGGVLIEENDISNCDVGIGVKRAVVRNNKLEDCGILFDLHKIIMCEVEGNTINGLPLGFFIDEDHKEDNPLVIDGDDQQYGQLVLAFCENVVIQNLNIQDTTIGILIYHITNLTMSNVVTQNCILGMFLNDHGPSPDPPDVIEFIHTQDLAFRDCEYGVQLQIRGFYEGVTYDANITIREFTGNLYDVILTPSCFSGNIITVPLNTKFFMDYGGPFQLSVLYEGNPYSNVVNVTSRYGFDHSLFPYSAVEFTVADLGTFNVTHRLVYVYNNTNNIIIDYQPYYNSTIIVQELNPMGTIPGYSGGMIGFWGIFSIAMIVVYLDKKLKKH